PNEGVKTVDLVCPGFAVDCLETLEEIAMENKALFLEAGGEEYRYIPALNDSDTHIDVLVSVLSHS
ncbi:MAG: ferrochelatase, partial [Methylovulum sp.]|nr:ferrochelatase [Methylovulum sp.]